MGISQAIVDAIHANFPESEWANAMNIALRESGGDPSAVNNTAYPGSPGYVPPTGTNSPEYSMGLFQINGLAWPDVAMGGDLLDPLYNIQQAAIIYAQYGWQPWGGSPVTPGVPPGTGTGSGTGSGSGGGGGASQAVAGSGKPALATGATDWSIAGVKLPGSGKLIDFVNRINDLLAYVEVNMAVVVARVVLVIVGILITMLGLYYLMQSLGD